MIFIHNYHQMPTFTYPQNVTLPLVEELVFGPSRDTKTVGNPILTRCISLMLFVCYHVTCRLCLWQITPWTVRSCRASAPLQAPLWAPWQHGSNTSWAHWGQCLKQLTFLSYWMTTSFTISQLVNTSFGSWHIYLLLTYTVYKPGRVICTGEDKSPREVFRIYLSIFLRCDLVMKSKANDLSNKPDIF